MEFVSQIFFTSDQRIFSGTDPEPGTTAHPPFTSRLISTLYLAQGSKVHMEQRETSQSGAPFDKLLRYFVIYIHTETTHVGRYLPPLGNP